MLIPYLRHNKDYTRQALTTLCHEEPRAVGALLSHIPGLFRRFFGAGDHRKASTDVRIALSKRRISDWFCHFHYEAPAEFGAHALERVLFQCRYRLWRECVWKRKPVTPIVAASRPSLYTELNVPETVRNLLDFPSFWRSEELCSGLQSGEFLSMGLNFFVDEMHLLLYGSEADWNERCAEQLSVLMRDRLEEREMVEDDEEPSAHRT